MNMTQLVVNIIQVVMKITQCVFNLKDSQRMCCEYQYQYQIYQSHTKAIKGLQSMTPFRPKWSPKQLGRPGFVSHACSMMTASSDFKAWFSRPEKATTEDLCLPNKPLLHCYIVFSMCTSVYHISTHCRYSTIAWGRFVVIKQQRMAEHANESEINIALHIITL